MNPYESPRLLSKRIDKSIKPMVVFVCALFLVVASLAFVLHVRIEPLAGEISSRPDERSPAEVESELRDKLEYFERLKEQVENGRPRSRESFAPMPIE